MEVYFQANILFEMLHCLYPLQKIYWMERAQIFQSSWAITLFSDFLWFFLPGPPTRRGFEDQSREQCQQQYFEDHQSMQSPVLLSPNLQPTPNRLAYLHEPPMPSRSSSPSSLFLPINPNPPSPKSSTFSMLNRPVSPRQSFTHALSSLITEIHQNRSAIERLESMLDRMSQNFHEKKNKEYRDRSVGKTEESVGGSGENSRVEGIGMEDKNCDQVVVKSQVSKGQGLSMVSLPKVIEEVAELPIYEHTPTTNLPANKKIEFDVLSNLSDLTEIESVATSQNAGDSLLRTDSSTTIKAKVKVQKGNSKAKQQKSTRKLSAQVFCGLFVFQLIAIGGICLIASIM